MEKKIRNKDEKRKVIVAVAAVVVSVVAVAVVFWLFCFVVLVPHFIVFPVRFVFRDVFVIAAISRRCPDFSNSSTFS